ncbi:orotate phosphoribosyltransferase [Selenihalanaerobacter shriftii]|uniref:Orotate phosphoribosyltransferase n=1 Tax=Selenihalanaerobacter shriftii TaxID=142842 RepID=A0A1T4QEP9_9FIRM|nr:orotate phosphoribosyltransferase [Selenihalanaerobacter shriftii]SKA02116.1 orotate phosphoribosyltransferase [Selenihalanaerobacter shriftii]
MDKERVVEIFKKTNVLQEGHFKLTSGKHSKQYLQCAQVLQYPEYTQELCDELGKRFEDKEIDLVIAPAIGGIIISYAVGTALGKKAVFAERKEGVMKLRRGFTIPKGAKVLVVEDVTTTGGSVREVIDVVEENGGEVIGVGILVDRSGGEIDFGVQKEALLTLEVEAYDPEECPLCKEGAEITKPGSRT